MVVYLSDKYMSGVFSSCDPSLRKDSLKKGWSVGDVKPWRTALRQFDKIRPSFTCWIWFNFGMKKTILHRPRPAQAQLETLWNWPHGEPCQPLMMYKHDDNKFVTLIFTTNVQVLFSARNGQLRTKKQERKENNGGSRMTFLNWQCQKHHYTSRLILESRWNYLVIMRTVGPCKLPC